MLGRLPVSPELRRVEEHIQRAYLALSEWRLQFCPAANDAPNAPLIVSKVWRFYKITQPLAGVFLFKAAQLLQGRLW